MASADAEDCAPAATAAALFLHRNTLRNRLKLIEELTGRDLDSPSSRTHFWLATTGWELGSAAGRRALDLGARPGRHGTCRRPKPAHALRTPRSTVRAHRHRSHTTESETRRRRLRRPVHPIGRSGSNPVRPDPCLPGDRQTRTPRATTACWYPRTDPWPA
ncbi:helix-turn-helix domain-containing protein [Rhodococcus jostii]|nr:helix-turn-helix domain-containing protein [Rhodococcus jostii]